jgi:hypothetical protein
MTVRIALPQPFTVCQFGTAMRESQFLNSEESIQTAANGDDSTPAQKLLSGATSLKV